MFEQNPERQKISVALPLRIQDPKILDFLKARNYEEFLEEVSTYQNSCVDLIINFWRLSKTVNKLPITEELSTIRNDLQRFSDSLKKNGFEIQDLVGKPWNDGLTSVEPIHFEEANEGELTDAIISEVIRPAIYLKGRVIERGEVIVKKPYSGKRNK